MLGPKLVTGHEVTISNDRLDCRDLPSLPLTTCTSEEENR
jgi:hypothetical protein